MLPFFRSHLTSVVACITLAPVLLQSSTGHAAADGMGTQQTGSIDRQPVLIHDVSGSTLLGSVQSTTIVWSDGSVSYSSNSYTSGPVVDTWTLGDGAYEGLLQGLVDSDAWILSDQWPQATDTPVHTVTVLDPTSNASAHTFSFWTKHGEYEGIGTVLGRLSAQQAR